MTFQERTFVSIQKFGPFAWSVASGQWASPGSSWCEHFALRACLLVRYAFLSSRQFGRMYCGCNNACCSSKWMWMWEIFTSGFCCPRYLKMTPQNGESYSLQSLETSVSPSSFAVSSVFLHETILGQEDFWPCVYCYIPLFPLSSSGCFASRSLPWFLFWNVQTKSLIELEMTRLARYAFGSLGLGTASCRQAVVTGAFEVSSICIPFGCTYISLAFGVL